MLIYSLASAIRLHTKEFSGKLLGLSLPMDESRGFLLEIVILCTPPFEGRTGPKIESVDRSILIAVM